MKKRNKLILIVSFYAILCLTGYFFKDDIRNLIPSLAYDHSDEAKRKNLIATGVVAILVSFYIAFLFYSRKRK